MQTEVFLLDELEKGNVINGPAIIIDKLSTILVEPNCVAKISETNDIGKLKVGSI